jgi:hypothetical protein
MTLVFNHPCIILDASCIINLYASKCMENILRSIPRSVTIAAFVLDHEALLIYGGPAEDVRQEKEKIDLQPLIEAGLLKIVTINSEAEAALHINFAAEIDDGESVTGAIAIHRNWAIGIDDRRARSLFSREVNQLQLIYTLELVKHWADTTEPPFEIISTALENIYKRAVYQPGQNHPLYPWWLKYKR